MRIAHVTATFPPYHGGTGTVCYHNALGLARLGHDVTVYTAGPAPAGWAGPPELAVRRLPALFRVGNAPFLPGLLGLQGFDLVHLHYPFFFGAELVALAARSRRLPLVVTYHQDVLFAGRLRHAEALHHRLIGRRLLARAARVLATSWDYARASRLAPLLHSRPGRVAELPNGVDVERFHPGLDGGDVRARLGLRPGDRAVLFVGALDRAHHFKGVGILLEALARLADPAVRLLVVGGGELLPAHRRRAAELGLGERVAFCGRVPDAGLPAHYAACDLLVLPSTTMGEAFGVVLLEAMACGRPAVASDLPGVRSVVGDGADGLLVPPGDAAGLSAAIAALLADPQRRRDMGARGRAKVEARYAWPVILPRLVRVYEEVLAAA